MAKVDQSNPFEAFAAQNGNGNGELKKFSDELLTKYKGKMLEIYIGDQCETINFEEYSVPQNCIIYGKLIDVLDRMLVLECYYVNEAKQIQPSSVIYINSFQVRLMTELNERGTLNDIFLSAKSSEKVRKALLHMR